MKLFFVYAIWKPSGNVSCYCAYAATRDEARAMPIGQRGHAVQASEALDWPEEIAPPNVSRATAKGQPFAFKLKSHAYCEQLLHAARVQTSDVPRVDASEHAAVTPSGETRPPFGHYRDR